MSALTGFLRGFIPETLVERCLEGGFRILPAPARVLCLGKAAPSLARAADALWPGIPGMLYGTAPHGQSPQSFLTLFGDHPFPTPENVQRTEKVLEWLECTHGPLTVLISGGASSLLVMPRTPWALEEKIALTKGLWRAGASIGDLNVVRARLSDVKAGGLLRHVHPFPCATGVWSDVGPGQFRIVGSGPSVPWRSRITAEQVLSRYGITSLLPLPPPRRSIDGSPADRCFLLFDGVALRRETAAFLRSAGYSAREVAVPELCTAEELSATIVRIFLEEAPRRAPALVGAGEALVEAVSGGRGGRCSHLAALVALRMMRSETARRWAFVALATDGVDGGAGAGAWTDWRCVPSEAEIDAAVGARDTGTLWEIAGTSVPRAPTGNNLRDLWAMVEVG